MKKILLALVLATLTGNAMANRESSVESRLNQATAPLMEYVLTISAKTENCELADFTNIRNTMASYKYNTLSTAQKIYDAGAKRKANGNPWDEALVLSVTKKVVDNELTRSLPEQQKTRYIQAYVELFHDGYDGR